MRRITAVILGLACCGSLLAQQTVTMTLKSGETVNGQLLDLNASGFIVRADNNERQIAKGDVAVIDFGGGAIAQPRELNALGGGHLLMLRNGTAVRGELVDVGGSQPLRLTFRTDKGDQDFSSNDVGRVYLSRPPVTPPPPPPPAAGPVIRVQANQRWTPTGITVRRGQRVEFSASGEVELATGGAVRSGPGGGSNRDQGAPLPGTPTGTLIGRVDPGRLRIAANPFVIGTESSVAMPNDGVLFLGLNDSELSDNRGWFEVTVTVK
jgi:small nuclear ribonucleoprotein (snRNP)-like protein